MKQELLDKAQRVIQDHHGEELEIEQSKVPQEEMDNLIKQFRGKLPVEEGDTLAVTIPKGMNKLGASIELFEQHLESESKESFGFDFKNRYYVDALYVIANTLEKYLGRIKPVPRKHQRTNSTVNYDEQGLPIQAETFEGYFIVPAFQDATFLVYAKGTMHVRLETDALKKKFEPQLKEMVRVINEELKKTSLYEGACVKIKTSKNWQGEDIWSFDPFFNKPNPGIILNPSEEAVVAEYIIPELNINGKRSYLFCGGYGNGKTETAMRIGAEATSQGYLFAYVKKSTDFTKILSLSRNYTKLLIFMEDLDELAAGDQRGEIINNVLNTLDGIDSKNSNVKVIFTTNHEKKLNPALRRPGRLDLITRFENPEIGTACRIMEYQFTSKNVELTDDIDIQKTIELLASFSTQNAVSGAVVAEVSNRAIRMFELHGSVSQERLEACAHSIKTQVEMMEEDVELDDATIMRKAFNVIGQELGTAAHN